MRTVERVEIRWRDFDEKERWKVWWGVTWRWIVVQIALFVLLFIIVWGVSGAAYLSDLRDLNLG